MTVFHYPVKSVLNKVIAQLLIPGHTIKETIQRSFIALKKESQPFQASIANTDHQCIVGKLIQNQNTRFMQVNHYFEEWLQTLPNKNND